MPRLLAPALLLLAAGAARGEVINGFDPNASASYATYARFQSGWPAAPMANGSQSFVGAGLDLSGIGWRVEGGAPTSASVTLISPQYIIGANHFGLSSTVAFTDGAGGVVTRNVLSTARLNTTYTDSQGTHTAPSDILVGRLDSPISAGTGVRPVAIAAPGTAYTGLPLLVYGQNSTYGANNFYLGRNTLANVQVNTFGPPYPDPSPTATAEFAAGTTQGNGYLTDGDSGGPLLARGGPDGNTLALIGAHFGVSNRDIPLNGYPGTIPPGGMTVTGSPDDISASSFLPDKDSQYIQQLNDLMRLDGYQVLLVPVPEPAGLLAVAVVAALAWQRRRARFTVPPAGTVASPAAR